MSIAIQNNEELKTNNQPTQFTIIHNEQIDEILPILSGNAFKLYYVLRTYSNAKYKPVFPSNDTLASKIGVHRATVTRLLKELVGFGLISIKKQKRKNIFHFISSSVACAQGEVAPVRHDMLRTCNSNHINKPYVTNNNKTEPNKVVVVDDDIKNKKVKNSKLANNSTYKDRKAKATEYTQFLIKKGIRILNSTGFIRWVVNNYKEVDFTEFDRYKSKKEKVVDKKEKNMVWESWEVDGKYYGKWIQAN